MGVHFVQLGDETLIDLRNDSVTPETLDEGVTAHDKDGNPITGTFTLNQEITEQDSLISQIKTALQGKAAGGGAIPEGYIKPSGTLEIAENGTHDVTEYASVNVNVPTGGGDAEKEVAALLSNTLTDLHNRNVKSLVSRACQGLTKLVTVNLPFVTSMGTYAFYGCTGLTDVNMPLVTSIPTQCFYGCTNLKHADFGAVSSIAAQAFNAATNLRELILRKNNSICTLNNTSAISNTAIGKGTGYIYVPSTLIDTYKDATNWSTFAAQFRAIEDYPDICGG